MGCDIHVFVEKYELLEDGELGWKQIPPPRIELFKNADGSPYMGDYWYFGRNYLLFGWLADVRNEMSWGTSRVEPLSEPRGLPDDVSKSIWEESQGWGIDGHSHTYYTLREMVQAMEKHAERTVLHRGWVNGRQYLEYLEKGSPSSWSGMVGGAGIEHVSENEMQQRLLDVRAGVAGADSLNHVYTEIRWVDLVDKALTGEWKSFIGRLTPLTQDDGSDIRIVMWFDN